MRKCYVLIVLSVVLALTSCGGRGGDGRPAVGFNETGMPIVDEKTTIKVMAADWQNLGDLNEIPCIQRLEERTNIHVEWQTFNGEAQEVLTLAFASKNSMPDAFLWSDMSASMVDKYGADGVILPVGDLIGKYAPNIKAAMDDVPDARRMSTSSDGKMYVIPNIFRFDDQLVRGATYINKKWLKDLGLSMPETADELYTVLKAFKTGDPNGNGRADEVPLNVFWNNDAYGPGMLFNSWGTSSAYTGIGSECNVGPFYIFDGKVYVSNTQEEYKEAVKFFNKLWSEGLINTDTFSGDKDNVVARNAASKDEPFIVGVMQEWTLRYRAGQTFDEWEYTELLPLKGPNGERHVSQPIAGIQANNYISGFTKQPEMVMRWMDAMADPEYGIEWMKGRVGVSLQKGGDGVFRSVKSPEGVVAEKTFWYGLQAFSDTWLKTRYAGRTEPEQNNRSRVVGRYLPFVDMLTVEHLRYTPGERAEVEAILPQIISYSKQKEAEWVTNGGVDAEWDAHLAQMKSMNIDRIVEIMQTASDRWYAIK